MRCSHSVSCLPPLRGRPSSVELSLTAKSVSTKRYTAPPDDHRLYHAHLCAPYRCVLLSMHVCVNITYGDSKTTSLSEKVLDSCYSTVLCCVLHSCLFTGSGCCVGDVDEPGPVVCSHRDRSQSSPFRPSRRPLAGHPREALLTATPGGTAPEPVHHRRETATVQSGGTPLLTCTTLLYIYVHLAVFYRISYNES